MTFESVCRAWAKELSDHVTGLEDAVQHLFGSWSRELLVVAAAERHLAVYPNGEPEVAVPFITGTPAADQITQRYTILVWEDAAAETARAYDDDEANLAWLQLYEAIKARLYVQASSALGLSDGYTRYAGGSFDMRATVRVIQINFSVRVPQSFT